MDIEQPTFSSQQVAIAAGMTPTNFRAYLARGHWSIVGNAQPAEMAGKGHLFTLQDALGYALAFRLTVMGAPSRLAFELGMLDCISDGLADALYRPQEGNAAWFIYYPQMPRVEASTLLIGSRPQVSAFFEHFAGETAVVIDLFALRDQVFRALRVEPEAA